MYVVYEVPGGSESILREGKQVVVPGTLVNWEVGEFRLPSGEKVPGVRINYRQQEAGPERRVEVQTVEVPPTARNVRVVEGELPAGYVRAPGEASEAA